MSADSDGFWVGQEMLHALNERACETCEGCGECVWECECPNPAPANETPPSVEPTPVRLTSSKTGSVIAGTATVLDGTALPATLYCGTIEPCGDGGRVWLYRLIDELGTCAPASVVAVVEASDDRWALYCGDVEIGPVL